MRWLCSALSDCRWFSLRTSARTAGKTKSMDRTGSAVWKGGLKGGNGTLSTGSGAIAEKAYSFRTRFEDEPGTNPEELIGAAHAACFSMAFSAGLEAAGMNPEEVNTKAYVTLGKTDAGPTVTSIRLETRAKVPGADEQAVREAGEQAKQNCPISRLLNAQITLDLQVV